MPHELAREALEAWVQACGRAWEAGDPDAVTALFTADAACHETPSAEPMMGSEAIHRYWSEGADQTQRNIRFGLVVLAVSGETGVARWWASFERVPSGAWVELDGVLEAEFDRSERCRRFREWWHRRETAAVDSNPWLRRSLES